MADKEKKATLLKLQRMKQLPRRCENVDYEAFIYADGIDVNESVEAQTEHGDIWLNDLFNKK
ncbi:hypothetical protein [Chryseobacterium sp. SL1]|uniref:hypothetical protein n=1 Tax=Chryseobacterium sp. SL1 TaxID=2995159 RepID=UPI0022743ECC|nr:hypothetical protein [Chryseobacterium sp. SL1]MCY1662527.1 hypothetical protein [Chryseobacterium sp. SL1]